PLAQINVIMGSIMQTDRLLGVELRHLLALQAVAEEGSFGRAAIRLGYTQSAVSQQIAALERIVGEKLIERPGGPRPVSPTEAGQLLVDPYVLIVPRDSSLAGRQSPPSLREIGDLPLIGYRQCRSMEGIETAIRRVGRDPNVVFRSDDNGTVQGLVAAGIG